VYWWLLGPSSVKSLFGNAPHQMKHPPKQVGYFLPLLVMKVRFLESIFPRLLLVYAVAIDYWQAAVMIAQSEFGI
jgi:hypothetical protein